MIRSNRSLKRLERGYNLFINEIASVPRVSVNRLSTGVSCYAVCFFPDAIKIELICDCRGRGAGFLLLLVLNCTLKHLSGEQQSMRAFTAVSIYHVNIYV